MRVTDNGNSLDGGSFTRRVFHFLAVEKEGPKDKLEEACTDGLKRSSSLEVVCILENDFCFGSKNEPVDKKEEGYILKPGKITSNVRNGSC